VRLEGSRPVGLYEGDIQITGGAVPILVPFVFVVSDGIVGNGLPLRGDGFVGEPGERINLDFKLVDQFGAPVGGIAHTWRPGLGGGRIEVASSQTDEIGIGFAEVILGPQIGRQEFFTRVGGTNLLFTGRARAPLSIETDGVVNAADLRVGPGIAPGSYMTIFGLNLSEAFLAANTPFLPYALAGVSVSFDVPGPRSLAGRLHFVSERQVNVQVPWELQGLNSAQIKVSIGDNSSALYTVPLNDYSPAAFEFDEPGTGRKLAAALDENFRLITSQNPVARGRVAQIYANGLGPVDNTPPSGEPSPAQPLGRTRVQPEVTIGGRPARVTFSGLAPGFVGLYQMNVEVAGDTPTGVQPLVITVGGVTSKSSNLPVN
jgi:uncharacterized protein (TIGR03437 family)